MNPSHTAQTTEKSYANPAIWDLDAAVTAVAPRSAKDPHIRRLLHRNATKIFTRLRQIKAQLTDSKDLLLLDYVINNTLGREKGTDQIANRQFTEGKRCRKTGQVIDVGCGLSSLKSVRLARQSLVAKGILFEEKVSDENGAQSANRYGLVFIRDLLDLQKQKKKLADLKQHTPRGYYGGPTTNQSPPGIRKQRCRTTRRKKKAKKQHIHRDHMDYLIDQIEQVTGDTWSRGAFARVVLGVDEGRIMELLSLLKDRGNIRNKGAWFIAVARKYRGVGVIKADAPAPPPTPPVPEGAASEVSYKTWLQQHKPVLYDRLSLPVALQANKRRPRTQFDTMRHAVGNHDPT